MTEAEISAVGADLDALQAAADRIAARVKRNCADGVAHECDVLALSVSQVARVALLALGHAMGTGDGGPLNRLATTAGEINRQMMARKGIQ